MPPCVRRYETWMAWETPEQKQEWPIMTQALHLKNFLTNVVGWKVNILDWTSATMAANDAAAAAAATPPMPEAPEENAENAEEPAAE